MSATPARRPQLTLEELQQLKWFLGGMLSLLGLGAVFYMEVDAWVLMLLTSVTIVTTMVRPTWPAKVPPLVHTLTFPVIVAVFAADLWLRTEVLPAMVRLDMMLLLYRNLGYRQRRDDLQLIVLGLFLVIVAGVLTVSLTFAVQLLVYTAAALALLLVVTLTDAVQGPAGRGPVPLGEVPAWAQHVHWPTLLRRLRGVLDWRVIGLGAALFGGVVAVSALLFLAIPRFQLENSMFLDRFISKKARTGFSDSIQFGDVTDIQQDNSLALSVDVSDQTAIPAAPYWRMLVLDVYDNGSFRLSPSLRKEEFESDRTSTELIGNARPRAGEPVQWTFFLEAGVSRYLPLLGRFETLRFRESENFRYAPRLTVVSLRDDPVTMTAYRVQGFEMSMAVPDPAFAERWRQRGDGRDQRPLQVRLPAFQRETDLVALQRANAEATGELQLSAADYARRVGLWLKRRHDYSLRPTIPGGDGDPLVRWLASREPGHCELFAGSFVLLARTAGFPSRVVTGFRGGSWNGYSNNFTIRYADAHAWAEIFDETAGVWLRADPLALGTEASEEVRGEAAVASRLDRSWKARVDSLRVFWYRRIVSFDQRSQAETLKAIKETTQASSRWIRDWLGEKLRGLKQWLKAPWDVRRLVAAASLLALVIATILGLKLLGRGWWRVRRRSGGRRQHPVRLEAARWLGLLGDENASGLEAESVRAELQRLRFGAPVTWPKPETVFRRARHALREARRLRRATRT